jgi:hypothetical protein
LNPESGSEIRDPITRPIPVKRKGGTSSSKVARVASDAHNAIAPNAKRSALMSKILLESAMKKAEKLSSPFEKKQGGYGLLTKKVVKNKKFL